LSFPLALQRLASILALAFAFAEKRFVPDLSDTLHAFAFLSRHACQHLGPLVVMGTTLI
jgi:hypothetical protein